MDHTKNNNFDGNEYFQTGKLHWQQGWMALILHYYVIRVKAIQHFQAGYLPNYLNELFNRFTSNIIIGKQEFVMGLYLQK